MTASDCSMQNATVSGVRRVAADDRDVGAVKRRDDRAAPDVRCRRHDLAREVRGGRVRNRVVRVDDIERLRRAQPARSCSPARAGTAARGRAGTSASRRDERSGPAGSRSRNGASLLMMCT